MLETPRARSLAEQSPRAGLYNRRLMCPSATPPPPARTRLWVSLVIVVFVLGIAGFPVARIVQRALRRTPAAEPGRAPARSAADALRLAEGWVDGSAADAAALAGAPTVIVVWSDADPASLRALGVADGWRVAAERWGLHVIGVHAPGYSFATDSAVVGRAARRAGATFPIALDPAGEVRRALAAPDRLPVIVMVDREGHVVGRTAGTPSMESVARWIRAQLVTLHPEQSFPLLGAGAATPASDPPRVIELGSGRVREGPLVGAGPGRAHAFTAEFRYQVEGKEDVPYPVGWWTPEADGLTAARGGADNLVALRYAGGALYAVISPPPGARVRLFVLRDEAWLPAAALGADAHLQSNGASYVDVDEPRLYELARGGGEHVVKLSPEAAGITLHALIVDPAMGAAPR
jgi:hypothetical protein